MKNRLFIFLLIFLIFFISVRGEDQVFFNFKEEINLNLNNYDTGYPEFLRSFNFKEGENYDEPGIRLHYKEGSKKLGRAVIFNLSLWFLDSIRYWATYANWIEDWQFNLTWEDQKKRIFKFEGNRFDSNPFSTNWSHALSGAIYFNFARYHRLTILESVIFETLSSFLWEYITEWREVISINDNFFSGLGGLPIGEPFYQIGGYLLSKRGFINQLVGSVLNPVIALSNLFGGKKWRRSFDKDYYIKPDFNILLGQRDVRFNDEKFHSSRQLHFGVESWFNRISGFGEPGQKETSINLVDTINGGISFGISFGLNGIEELTLNTKVVYLGHFKQNIRASETEGLYGYSFLAGMGSAFGLFKKKSIAYYDTSEYHYDFAGNETPEQPTQFTDKLAIINLAGPVFDLTLYSGKIKFGLSFESYLDFALVNSLALNKFSETNDLFEKRMKTTLAHYGYYYAFGYTIAGSSSLDLYNFTIKGNFKYQKYDSIEGLDRFQDRIEDDSNVKDSRAIYKLSMGYKFERSPVQLIFTYENSKREGNLKNCFDKEIESRIYSQVKISF
ncbi:MAG: DUF3943 domain-containing protein [Acidobacteriota bacterium]